jgi:hypothetical protein
MANDEKMVARGEETLPADDNVPSLDDSQDGPLSKAAPKDDDKARLGKTLSFPGAKSQQAPSRLDDSFGMPDFGFFADPVMPEPPAKASANPFDPLPAAEDLKPAAALPADETGGAMPLQEGTGWEPVGSIMKPSSLRARIEMQEADDSAIGQLFANDDEMADEAGDAEKSASQRHEANVTPFPGTVLHLHSERTPADMLRGGGKSADVFEELAARAVEEKAPPSDDPEANPDALADAVQSALRNIYGSYSEPQQPDAVDLGGYTVADALAGPADVGLDEAAWAEERTAPVEWAVPGSRSRDYDADQQPSADAGGSEPALDYFYNQRRQERAAPQLSPEMSLNEYAARTALEDKWEPEADQDDDRRVMPFPTRDRGDYRGRAPEPAVGEASIIRTGGFFSDDSRRSPLEPEWGQPPYNAPQNARGTITPTYAPAVATPADQMPGQAPDSGHLLGAAGLGLIGGIALAGVLAVFVFNSFVDEGGQIITDGNSKITEQLAPAQIAANPLETRAPVIRPVEAAKPAPVAVEPPTSAPAAPAPEPRRSAALVPPPAAPAPLPTPDSGGGARLVASSASGASDAPIRLNIVVADGDAGDALVSLKGLPKDAKLSTEGIDVGGGQRLLPPSGLKDLTITVPPSAAGTHRLEAQLLKDSAQTSVSEPVPFTLSVTAGGVTAAGATATGQARVAQATPGAARTAGVVPTVLPDEAPLPETDFLTQVLIRDGNKLMREGDIAAAQRTYEKASASNNPEAFLALGRSYDPTYFEKLNVKTGRPDPAKAFDSYKKALDGGLGGARAKIDALKQWLQR